MTVVRFGARHRHPFATLTYASAFGDGREPIDVAPWGAAVLASPISESDQRDVSYCYPFMPIEAGADLKEGLHYLRERKFVSAVLVTDPLRQPDEQQLAASFPVFRPFKQHYVFDRDLGIDKSRRRWREVSAARNALDIREISYRSHLDDFIGLYGNLVSAKQLVGSAVFSRAFFATLATFDGLRAVGAFRDRRLVSMMLFMGDRQATYSFVAGTSEEGRRFAAHYGLYGYAIENFDDVRFVNLGGAPGLIDDPNHGIAHVKRKLTNTVMQSYLCGAILDPQRYESLSSSRSSLEDFFPGYRAPDASFSGTA